jgi:septal ring factor EnvC (AmiA/AmiB activator)
MIKIYALIIILAVLGSVGYGAMWYYKDTQERLATLQENNAKLETALETSEASIESLQQDMQKFAALNQELQVQLQKAEAYGDELRGKLSRINLVQEALRDAQQLEGKMNGASAKLWRGIMEDTGGSGDAPLPNWLQPDPEAGAGDQSSN